MRRIILLLVMLMSGRLWAAAPALDHLRDWMCGTFSSATQAAADSDYFHIVLHMSPIWLERADGPWLYVEQAVAATADKPYRQRVYRLLQAGEGRFISEVHELPEPQSRFVGAWKDAALVEAIGPDSLAQRKGCAVRLTWVEESQCDRGSTVEDACASSLRGAAYATSQVTVRADGLDSWDRGYDDHGLQVWGAKQGPYLFRKDNPSNP